MLCHGGTIWYLFIVFFFQNLEEENKLLTLKVQDYQRQLSESKMNRDKDTSEVLNLQQQLGNKVTELYELHEQIVAVIQKESNS